MGACCSGKENKKGENQEEEIYTKSSRIYSSGENPYNQIKPTFELEIENSALSKNLFFIIKKMVNEGIYREEIKLSKFPMEHLWNVYRFYFDDHSDSDYMIYDYRENSLRQENFLKKFKAVNYKIEQIKNFTNSQFLKFRKYIKDKQLIIIAKEDSIITIEEFIYFVLENKINSKIFLLDYNLTAKNSLTELNRNYLESMDFPNFYKFPYIFLSLRFFPHLKSESVVFLDLVNTEEIPKKDINSKNVIKIKNMLFPEKKFCEDDFYDSKILSFFNYFKIGANLKLNLNEMLNNDDMNPNLNLNCNRTKFHSINTKCILENPKNNKNSNYLPNLNNQQYNFTVKFFEINNLSDITELIKKKDVFLDYIEMIKQEIQLKKSIVIQVPYEIDKELLITVLLFIVWKITEIEPINLTSYLKEYLLFIPMLKDFSEESFQKILNYLELNFGLSNKIDNYIINKCTNNFYQTFNSKSFKSNKNSANFFSSNMSGKENELNIKNTNNFGINETLSAKSGFDTSNKKRKSQYNSKGQAYGNNFHFNNNNLEEKSEEEKEKIKQEFYALISNLRKEVTKKEDIVNIISTLEKIIGNILDNIENFKYRTIKCDSNTFKKFIEVNTNALDILKLFGFKYVENKNDKFFVFEESVNIEFLKNSREELFNLKNQLLRNQI